MTNRRPRLFLTALRMLDPNRGISIPLAFEYWGRTAIAYAQLGEWSAALSAASEGRRRAPRHQRLQVIDMSIAAARGDVPALEAARARAQEVLNDPLAAPSGNALALLATRGARPGDARSLARRWLAAARPTAIGVSPVSDVALRAVAEDWASALPRIEPAIWDAALPHPTWVDSLDQLGSRAVVLAHLGRVDEARALEARIAGVEGRSWNMGTPTLWRARIAAHLGEKARATELAEQAVRRGALLRIGGLLTIDSDPFLVPLRDQPRFRALAQPSPEDRP